MYVWCVCVFARIFRCRAAPLPPIPGGLVERSRELTFSPVRFRVFKTVSRPFNRATARPTVKAHGGGGIWRVRSRVPPDHARGGSEISGPAISEMHDFSRFNRARNRTKGYLIHTHTHTYPGHRFLRNIWENIDGGRKNVSFKYREKNRRGNCQ